jgi:hypothetical protein
MLLADVLFSFYVGASQTRPSDLHIVQTAGENDATLHGVTWHGFPFRFEIYYGIRLTFTPPQHPWTRFALDYTHYKIYEDPDTVVPQSGVWHGASFHDTAPVRARVQSFEITHGLNMLGIDVLQQVAGRAGNGFYLGGGPVIFIPHSENRVDGLPGGDGYQWGGTGFQAIAGAQTCIGKHSLYGEIKYSNGAPTVSIAQGYAQTRVDTVHELLGVNIGRNRYC